MKPGNGNVIERSVQMVCDMEIGGIEFKDATTAVSENNGNHQKEESNVDTRPTRKEKNISNRKNT